MKLVVPGCTSLLGTNKNHNAKQSEQQCEESWWKEREETHCSKTNVERATRRKKTGNVVIVMGP